MNNTLIVQIKIPKKFTIIHDNAFKDYIYLKNVTLSDINVIGTSAFEGCKSLTYINLPNSNSSAFYGCISLNTIKLPSSITACTSGKIFDECASLRKITIPNNLRYTYKILSKNALIINY